jgi:6-phosphogluconolactonase
MKPSMLMFQDLDEASRAAAETIAEEVERRTPCSLVLSGGSTPRRLFDLLSTEWRTRLPWSRIHLFWSDERFVPPHDAASNFGMAAELFIDHVPVPAANVHRVPTERPSASAAADAYEDEVRGYFAETGSEGFDLALLGVGTDGHTASLFPGRSTNPDRWVEAVVGPEHRPPRDRITMTYRALSAVRRVHFLAGGPEKRAVLSQIAAGADLPAGRVMGTDETLFLLDRAAAPVEAHGTP